MNHSTVELEDRRGRLLPRKRFGAPAAVLGGAAALALLLGGCTDEAAPEAADSDQSSTEQSDASDASSESDASEQSAGDSRGEATFSAGDREFTVELTTCGVYDDGGEIVLSGHATEVGGDATGFLDGDLTTLDSQSYGEFRIDIGASGPFESTDEFLALGDPTGGGIAYSEEAHGHVIIAKAWNQDGDDLGEASLIFVCS